MIPSWDALCHWCPTLRSDSGDEEARSFELPDGKIIQVHTKFYNRSLASFEKSRSKVLAQRGVQQSEVFFFIRVSKHISVTFLHVPNHSHSWTCSR